MPESARRITREDILAPADYAARRKQLRAERVAAKPSRTLHVGPHITFLFENYASMWLQVQEMLYIEKGGEAQIADELAAYNPMIPQGSELTATMMIEVEDADRRARVLAGLGRIEEHVALRVGNERIAAVAEGDIERTNAAGKASAVHFLHFPFTPAQITAFRDPGAEVLAEVNHPNYGHMAIMPQAMREALAKDFA